MTWVGLPALNAAMGMMLVLLSWLIAVGVG